MVNNKQRLLLNRKGMRKAVILLMTLVLVTASAGTAAAKKPGEPSPGPVLYNVKMDLYETSYGFFSPREDGCTSGGTLDMRLEESRSGSLLIADGTSFTSEADLYLYLVAEDESTFIDCYPAYRATNPFLPEPGPGFFQIVFDRKGALEKITWHFDVEMEGTKVTHKYALTSQNKKGSNSVRLEWDEGTGVVSGSFELWDYTNKGDGPEWTLIGTRELQFTLRIKSAS